jgi:hypothetical protein
MIPRVPPDLIFGPDDGPDASPPGVSGPLYSKWLSRCELFAMPAEFAVSDLSQNASNL